MAPVLQSTSNFTPLGMLAGIDLVVKSVLAGIAAVTLAEGVRAEMARAGDLRVPACAEGVKERATVRLLSTETELALPGHQSVVVAPGIAEALLTTAMGLAAAVPAVLIYNGFTRSISGYRAQLADASHALASLLSLDVERAQLGRERVAAERGPLSAGAAEIGTAAGHTAPLTQSALTQPDATGLPVQEAARGS